MSDRGYYETGFEPDIEAARLIPQPEPANEELIQRLQTQRIEAITADLRAQGALDGETPGNRIFAHQAPRLRSNFQLLLDYIERVRQHRIVEAQNHEDEYLALDF